MSFRQGSLGLEANRATLEPRQGATEVPTIGKV